MQQSGLFVYLPIWILLILTTAVILLAVELGYRWARHKHRSDVEKEAPIGMMVGALLGLVAFLLAFTFGLASDRYNDRRIKLLAEVNAIQTNYLRADLIPEPHRTDVRQVLRNYVEERLQWTHAVKTVRAESAEKLLGQLWQHAAAAGKNSSDVIALFVDSANRVIDLHEERLMLRERSHIPSMFWIMLYLIAVISLAATGYYGGVAGTARSPVMIAVAVSFALVITMIADIDRPGEGLINVSQQQMIELRDWMDRTK